MPAITLHTSSVVSDQQRSITNTVPTLLQTPSGLAILEIQGTIHAPFPAPSDDGDESIRTETPIGRLEFPLYDPHDVIDSGKWMKRVYLYVGKHQRLTGEVKKLPKSLVVIGKRERAAQNGIDVDMDRESEEEELEILEVIQHKIIFGGRPEPVGD